MTAVKPPPYAPGTDQEWARSIMSRLRQLETTETVRAGEWVLSTDEKGTLTASKPGAGTLTLAGGPDDTDPDGAPDTNGYVTAAEVTKAVTGDKGDLSDLGTWLDEQWQKFLTPKSPLDWSNLLGLMPNWLLPSTVPVGAITNQPVNQILDPKFDLAILTGSGRWSTSSDAYRGASHAAKVTANGQGTMLRSNVIKVRAGQIITVTIRMAAVNLQGSGNDLLELNVLPYTGTGTDLVGAGAPIPIQHIGVPASSTGDWAVVPSGAKTVTLTGSWVVTGGYDGAALLAGITDSASSGDVYMDDAELTLSATTIPQGWITDLVNDGLEWSNGIQNAQTWLTQIGQIFNNELVTPINSYVQQVKDWFANLWTPTKNDTATTKTRQLRKAQNDAIIGDWLHQQYPVGSIGDTAASTVGGKRTWWGAVNDNLLLVAQMLGLAPTPPDPTADVGTFAMNTQTRVITNESTLSQVQAKVDALAADDNSVAGRKFVSPASGGTAASWGSTWATSTTNGNVAAKSDKDLFSMTLPSSSTVDLKVTGRYTGGVTLTDDQVASLVFYEAAQPMAGGNGPVNTLKARMSADGQSYIYARVQYTSVALGYATGGVEQPAWATASSITVPAGALVELQCGNSSGHRVYQVRVNGSVVIPWFTETGTNSAMGSSNRGGGQDQLASHGTFNDVFQPARIRQFSLRDTNVAAVTFGTSARFYRVNTAAASFTTTNAITPITTNILDTTEYCSPDITLNPGGITFDTPGRYQIHYVVRFNASQTIGMAPCLMRNGPGGAVIYAEGVNYGSANMIGLEGVFEFNTQAPVDANGNPTEAWYVGMDMPGSNRTYGVVGDGGGFKTWVSITRIA